MINSLTGNPAGIKHLERRKWDTKSRLLASVDKARRLIGYEPQVKFEEGLKNAINWFQCNWENIEKSARFGPGASSAVRSVVSK